MNLKSLSQLGAADPLPLQLGPKVEKPNVAKTAPDHKQVAPGIFQQADGRLFTQLPLPPRPKVGRLSEQGALVQLDLAEVEKLLLQRPPRRPRIGDWVLLPNGDKARIRAGNAVAGWRLEGRPAIYSDPFIRSLYESL